MKRMISVLALAGFAAMAWAQDATNQPVDVNALADQVKALAANASKLKISGYAIGAESFSPSDWLAKPFDYVDVLNKQQKDGVFVRTQLTYDSSMGGFNSRFEYDPNNVNTGSSTSAPSDLIALKYAEPYIRVLDSQLTIGAGLLRDTDFAYKSQIANDYNTNLFTGVVNPDGFPTGPYVSTYQPNSGGAGQTSNLSSKKGWAASGAYFSGMPGAEVLIKPSVLPGLELGLASNDISQVNGATPSIGDIRDSLSYLASYSLKDYGDLKLGYSGAGQVNTWSNFFGTVDVAAAALPEVKGSLGFEALHIAQGTDTDSHTSVNILATAGYDFRDFGLKPLWVGEDFGMFTSGATFGATYAKLSDNTLEDKPGLSSSTRVQYTFAKLLPGMDVTPMLSYRFFDYYGTTNAWAQGVEPAVQVVDGSATFALGWGHYTGAAAGSVTPVADVITLGTMFAY